MTSSSLVADSQDLRLAIASATLRGSGSDAKDVIRKLTRYLNNAGEKGAIHHEFTTSTTD